MFLYCRKVGTYVTLTQRFPTTDASRTLKIFSEETEFNPISSVILDWILAPNIISLAVKDTSGALGEIQIKPAD